MHKAGLFLPGAARMVRLAIDGGPGSRLGDGEHLKGITRLISRRAADVRVGPAPLAHGALPSRCMRCVQWLAKRQRERINILQPAPFTI